MPSVDAIIAMYNRSKSSSSSSSSSSNYSGGVPSADVLLARSRSSSTSGSGSKSASSGPGVPSADVLIERTRRSTSSSSSSSRSSSFSRSSSSSSSSSNYSGGVPSADVLIERAKRSSSSSKSTSSLVSEYFEAKRTIEELKDDIEEYKRVYQQLENLIRKYEERGLLIKKIPEGVALDGRLRVLASEATNKYEFVGSELEYKKFKEEYEKLINKLKELEPKIEEYNKAVEKLRDIQQQTTVYTVEDIPIIGKHIAEAEKAVSQFFDKTYLPPPLAPVLTPPKEFVKGFVECILFGPFETPVFLANLISKPKETLEGVAIAAIENPAYTAGSLIGGVVGPKAIKLPKLKTTKIAKIGERTLIELESGKIIAIDKKPLVPIVEINKKLARGTETVIKAKLDKENLKLEDIIGIGIEKTMFVDVIKTKPQIKKIIHQELYEKRPFGIKGIGTKIGIKTIMEEGTTRIQLIKDKEVKELRYRIFEEFDIFDQESKGALRLSFDETKKFTKEIDKKIEVKNRIIEHDKPTKVAKKHDKVEITTSRLKTFYKIDVDVNKLLKEELKIKEIFGTKVRSKRIRPVFIPILEAKVPTQTQNILSVPLVTPLPKTELKQTSKQTPKLAPKQTPKQTPEPPKPTILTLEDIIAPKYTKPVSVSSPIPVKPITRKPSGKFDKKIPLLPLLPIKEFIRLRTYWWRSKIKINPVAGILDIIGFRNKKETKKNKKKKKR